MNQVINYMSLAEFRQIINSDYRQLALANQYGLLQNIIKRKVNKNGADIKI